MPRALVGIILPLCLGVAVVGMVVDDVPGAPGGFDSDKLKPIPSTCLDRFLSPAFDVNECLPVLWNQMVVSAATSKLNEELKRLKRDVSDETYYTVELYNVVVRDKSATHVSQLRVLPQDYKIYTVITEPQQDQSADAPEFSVRVVGDVLVADRRRAATNTSSVPRRMQTNDIPESQKFSFDMKVSEKLTLTRSYYRHLPPPSVGVKGILIQYHGWDDTCEEWEAYSKTTAIADKYGLILITACGSNYGWFSSRFNNKHGWNAGTCCIQRKDIDDVEYTKTIIKRENKNNLPVYGYGYSNGGMMVEALLCHKVIQSAVSVNGVLALPPGLQGSFRTCSKLYKDGSLGPKPLAPRVASVHCLDDEYVPYKGSSWYEGWLYGTYFPRTNRDLRHWASRIGCKDDDTTKTKINDWITLKEWKCPAEERVALVKRFECKRYDSSPHKVVRTSDFNPAEWAARFFLSGG
ncbi:hypothetical protein FOZ60_011191 [Perkinsus olseni]|uniref:Uncharacterized protein n=3 Tax=Perkinsus olseni TaxID=32597 RepID=A0A7J6NGA3_PEROL|nr:hypothetical protein FOZ60_011191 [Perkinsus olseni]